MVGRSSSPATSDVLRLRRDPATGLEAVFARFHGHAYDMHMHDDEWLIGMTHDGLQDFFCRGRRQLSTPGRIILMEPGERHDGQAGGVGGFAYSMLYLPATWLREEMGGDAAIGFRRTVADDTRLGSALHAASLAVLEAAPRAVVEGCRDAVIERLRVHLGAVVPREPPPDESVARRAMDFLEAHFAENIGLEDIVAASGAASRFQLARSFKARFGASPHACLVHLRLAAARRHLRSRVPPADVAYRCGFADQSHMGRWFRRAYGLPQAAYAQGRTNVPDRPANGR